MQSLQRSLRFSISDIQILNMYDFKFDMCKHGFIIYTLWDLLLILKYKNFEEQN